MFIRRKSRKARVKKKSIKTLKNKLDAAFSAMIRKRDAGNSCITCPKPLNQAGHFIRREILATRWHPQNVNGQCAHCNCWLHGNLLEYRVYLDEKFGEGTADRLHRLSRLSWKPDREALEKLIEAAKVGHEYYSEIWDFYGATLQE